VTTDAAITAIQFAYPQIYYACHTRHQRKRSTAQRVSWRDAELLVHLDTREPVTPTMLAAHMGLAPSTVSEAVSKLERLGYVAKARDGATDRRRVGLVLTPKGVDVVRASSVLESDLLRAALSRLSPREVARAVNGIGALARACRQTPTRKRR
jgi:DNA-binding MarR family transcriptional regulator